MDKFVIAGGVPLEGEIPVSGSKNSALPALAAALLTEEPVTLCRIPRVRDIRTMQRLLVDIGAQLETDGESVRLHTAAYRPARKRPMSWSKPCAPPAWCWGRWWRAAAAPAFRCPAAAPSARGPSTCTSSAWSGWARPMHQEHGYIEARAPDGLRGADIVFDRITVTGTEDLMMAAVLARGRNRSATMPRASRKSPTWPRCSTKMGAQIEGAGTSVIRIQGVAKLARRRSHHHSRPHRSRHLRSRRRHHRRRSDRHRLRPRAPGGARSPSCSRPASRSASRTPPRCACALAAACSPWT